MEIRAYVDPVDARPMQELQSRIWPVGDWHPGGLGWELATFQLGDQIFVAVAEDRVVGWGARGGGEQLAVQVQPGAGSAAGALIDRVVDVADGELRIAVTDADGTLQAALLERGFAAGSDAIYGMWMDATERQVLVAPGYSVRPARPDEVAARVDAHRAAWRPIDMPWPPDRVGEIDPEATSSFTEEKYARCRAAWLYDSAFDLVAVAPDGTFAANCLAWFDPSIGLAEIEPLGVHPDHRRKGLAGSLCHEVGRRVAERGGSEVYIHSGPNEGYPAPPAAYTKAGFRTAGRGSVYVRRG